MAISTRILAVAASAALVLATAACASPTTGADDGDASADKTTIRIGFNPGPYREMFEGGIVPILEEQGYTVEPVEFTDGIVVNVALAQGEIDANIMQHPVYLDFVNAQEGITNAPLVQIPTPPMALFGGKRASLDDVAEGSTITVPNSPSNLYRGLLILRDIGWIDFDDIDDPNTADLSIITDNPKNLQITAIENAQQVPALQDVDYATIQGNFVVANGLPLADALALEDQPVEFSVVVATRDVDQGTPWAEAIAAAYRSAEFIEFVQNSPEYDGYVLPDWFE